MRPVKGQRVLALPFFISPSASSAVDYFTMKNLQKFRISNTARTRLLCAMVLALGFIVSGCVSSQAKREAEREKLVPEKTQEKSQQMQGQQELYMDQMGSTSSEQAGARHDNAVLPKKNPDSERARSKK